MDERVKNLLLQERDGCHGESERRAVAEFVLDALEGNDDMSPEDVCSGLAEAALRLRERIEALQPEPVVAKEGPCVRFEYDLTYTGGDYAYVPLALVETLGPEKAFARFTGHDPCHIISYNQDELYHAEGEFWEE